MSAVLSTRTSAFITLLSVMLALWLGLQFGDRSMPVRSRIDNVGNYILDSLGCEP